METHFCQSCIALQKDHDSLVDNRSPNQSLGFMHNLSLDLHYPFQSIALLIDCALSRSAKDFNIRIVKMQNGSDIDLPSEAAYEQNYIQIKFNGDVLTNQQAHKMAHFDQTQGYDFSFNFRMGLMGLGKTGLMICNDGKFKKIILFSVDDRINPKYSKNPNGYLWIEEIETRRIQNIAGQYQKPIIQQICRIFHIDLNSALQCPEGSFKILVFHNKIFVTSKKLMFYQLSEAQFNRDIEIYHNNFRIDFLDKLGYQLANHAQICFSGYYSLLYLKPTLKIKVGNIEQEFHGLTYQQYLQKLQQNGMIIKIPHSLKRTKQSILYCAKQNYFANNNGIILYSNGRMINRFQTEFGKMFEECFYQKKYRLPPKNIFKFLGIIQFEDCIKPNILHTKVKGDDFNYQHFLTDLNQILDQYLDPPKSQSEELKPKYETRSLETNKIQNKNETANQQKDKSRDFKEKEQDLKLGAPKKKQKMQRK